MKLSRMALGVVLVVAPFSVFADDYSPTETEFTTPDMAVVPDMKADKAGVGATLVSGSEALMEAVSETTGDAVDAAEHHHGTMKKAVEDASDSAETLKKSVY